MYVYVIIAIILCSLIFYKKEQSIAFATLLCTYLLVSPIYKFVGDIYPLQIANTWQYDNLKTHYFITNSIRIVQHLAITFILYFFVYKDRRSFIPILVNTLIILVYCFCNLLLFVEESNYAGQRFLYEFKYIFSTFIFISLLDFGNSFYDRVYTFSVFKSSKYMRSISTTFNLLQNKEENKEVA